MQSPSDTLIERCADPAPPAAVDASALDPSELDRLEDALRARGFYVRSLNTCGNEDRQTVLQLLATAFAFPGYFGRNWDAVIDCLSDLSWLLSTGYCCVVPHSAMLRTCQPRVYADLVAAFEAASERFRDEQVALKLVLS